MQNAANTATAGDAESAATAVNAASKAVTIPDTANNLAANATNAAQTSASSNNPRVRKAGVAATEAANNAAKILANAAHIQSIASFAINSGAESKSIKQAQTIADAVVTIAETANATAKSAKEKTASLLIKSSDLLIDIIEILKLVTDDNAREQTRGSFPSQSSYEDGVECLKCHKDIYDQIPKFSFPHANIAIGKCKECHFSQKSGRRRVGWKKNSLKNYSHEHLLILRNLLEDSAYAIQINIRDKKDRKKAREI